MSDILSQTFNIIVSQPQGMIEMNGITLRWDRDTPVATITMMEFGEEKTYWCFDIFSGLEHFVEEVLAA